MSPFLDLLIFTALYNQNCPVEMKAESDDYSRRLEAGAYRAEFAPQGAFMRGLVHFKAREWEPAIQDLDEAIQTPNQSGPFKIWSMLYRGYALDALGERDKAVEMYEAVAAERPRWKSKDYAEQRRRHRFKESDPEMDVLLL